MFKLSNSSLKNRKGVDPRLIAMSDLAIQISPIDFGHPKHGGLRSPSTQNKLYLEGFSKLDGYTKISDHQIGKALDFFAFVDGKASWDHHDLAIVGASFLQAASVLGIKASWGGLWKNFKDYPHIYLLD